MSDPVAWIMIEKGWKVVASDGIEVGRVHEIAGDESADIFDGLAVTNSILGLSSKYVPSEIVGVINDGAVHLTLSKEEFDRLGEYEEPAVSEQIGNEKAPNKIVQALKRAFFLDR
jgi:hypothetical protein